MTAENQLLMLAGNAHKAISDAELLALITGHIQEVFWLADPHIRTMIYISPGYERVWGRSCQSLIDNPRSFLDAVHPDDLDRVLETIAGQPEGRAFEHEYRIVRPDGSLRWVWDRGLPIRDVDGTVRRFVGAALDVTSRKQAEAALADLNATLEQRVHERTTQLEETKRRLELAAKAAGLGFWELNVATDQVIFDQTLTDRMGYPPSGPNHKSGWGVVHPEDEPSMRAVLRDLQTQTSSRILRFRTIRANGSVRQIECGTIFVPEGHGLAARVVGASRDITEEVERAERLHESEQYSRLLFDATPNATVLVNDRLCAVRFNAAFERMMRGQTGGRTPPAIAEPLSALFPSDAVDRLRALCTQPWPSEWPQLTTELTLSWPNRTDVHTEVMVSPVLLLGDVHHLLTFVDVTARVQAQRALQGSREVLREANQEMERATQLKDEFLSMMSHELRTPLSSILGIAEAIRDGVYGVLPDSQARAIALVQESGQHLLQMINDVLDLSKIETGHLALSLSDIDVCDLLTSAERLISPQAARKRLRLLTATAPGLPSLRADARRVLQIVLNLVSNAVKFTSAGGSVQLAATSDATRRTVCLSVTDTGPGIDTSKHDRLFQPFTQIDSSLAREHEGTGLGLALVRRLAEMHGGVVGVTSEPGRGSCFSVELPQDGPVPVFSNGWHPLAAGDDTRPRVLLASRQSGFSNLIHTTLERLGFAVTLCTTGPQALDSARQGRFSVALVDVHVPGLGGVAVMRRLAARRSVARIVAVTSVNLEGDTDRCLEAGADVLLRGPAQPDALRAALSESGLS
jgi:PAS domain S-box-containing protein